MEFSVLGSGSAGNSVLVRDQGTCVLIDAGLSLKATRARAALLGIELDSVDAILVTHEHGDHWTHAGRLSAKLDAPVYLSDGTREAVGDRMEKAVALESLSGRKSLSIGSLEIELIPKIHDALEPLAFLVHKDDATLGIFSDLGTVDQTILDALSRCNLLFMEANHDLRMLREGPYPAHLRGRVGGRFGHLNNDDAARAVQLSKADLRALVIGHISAKNNSTDEVRRSFVRNTGRTPGYQRWLSLQATPTPLIDAKGKALAKEPRAEITRPVAKSGRRAGAVLHPPVR